MRALNWTSPITTRPGAVAAGGPDEGVAAHYGRPNHEQRDLAAGRAVVDLSHLGVLWVSGSDRLTWLHNITSQFLSNLAPGQSTEMLVLDPNGRIEHAAAVLDDGETTWLITETGGADPLLDYLDSMRFAMRVEAGIEPGLAVLGTSATGPEPAGAVLTWLDPWPGDGAGSTRYGPEPAEHPGAQWQAALHLVPRDELSEHLDHTLAQGATLAGVWAWEALRVAHWRPRHAVDVDERTIPHELDWLRTAVHLEKGCYRGQETVARVFNMGRPPRRVVMLHLDGSEHTTPEEGAAVMSGERQVGRVTSVVRHYELGPIALALVKRSVDPAAPLIVDGIAAAQEVIASTEGFGTGRPPPGQRPKVNPALRRPGR